MHADPVARLSGSMLLVSDGQLPSCPLAEPVGSNSAFHSALREMRSGKPRGLRGACSSRTPADPGFPQGVSQHLSRIRRGAAGL